jgi:hypothetical protein
MCLSPTSSQIHSRFEYKNAQISASGNGRTAQVGRHGLVGTPEGPSKNGMIM